VPPAAAPNAAHQTGFVLALIVIVLIVAALMA
jgi:hypothetical protein